MPDFSRFEDPIGAELEYLRKRSEVLRAEIAREPESTRPAIEEEMRRLRERVRILMKQVSSNISRPL